MGERISIIVPVYNAEKTLERCVSSLVGQTYQNIEIILVNDGSRDNSLSVCYALAGRDDRIRVIDKPNGGVSSARNAGLDAAQGDCVMFCDSDDWAHDGWCATMLEYFRPDDLTVCDIARETESAGQKEDMTQTVVETAERKDYLHYLALMCSPVNKIFSRAVIERHHLRFMEEMRLGEDFCFALSYLCEISGKVHFVYRKLYIYDESTEGSLTKRAPSIEQTHLFYSTVTSAMRKLNITDAQSIASRNWLVTGHYDRIFTELALRKDISLRQKLKIAESIRKLESFSACCAHGVEWANPIYIKLFRKKRTGLIVLYLILRSWRDALRA